MAKGNNRAVMDSRNNLANQEVFRIAKAADPAGEFVHIKRLRISQLTFPGLRTVAVMTKLDALQHGDEPAVSNARF